MQRYQTNCQTTTDGRIFNFWDTVNVKKCHYYNYIEHLNKVLPKINKKGGDATGYRIAVCSHFNSLKFKDMNKV